jgi:hypothetical protein
MKFLVPNYSCLQNPWLGGYRAQTPVVSVLCPQLNLLTPPPPKKKISWVRHWTYQRNVITFIFKDQGVLDTWRWWWHIPSKCQGSVTLLLSITWILNISAAGTSILQIILHYVLYSILMNKLMHEATCIWFTFVWAFTPTPSTQMFTFNIQV